MLTIILIEEQTLFRELMVAELEKLDAKVIIYEAATLTEATNLINYYKHIDLIILNVSDHNEQALDLPPFSNKTIKRIPIVLLKDSKHLNQPSKTYNKECIGHITKYSTKQQLLICIKTVLGGNTYISPEILSLMNREDAQQHAGKDIKYVNVLDSLSERQQDILKYLALGYSNKKIAQSCKISEGTVKLHVSSILKLLGASNRTEAVIKVNELRQ